MPILDKELDLYPEELLTDDSLYTDSANQWWVLYTHSRFEKKLMRYLLDEDIAFSCPQVTKTYRSPNGRQRRSHLPLFTGYVFLYGDEMDRYKAVSSGYVSRVISVRDGERLRSDLQKIYTLINSNIPITIEERLQAGDPVRIKSGSLKGVEGVVIRREGTRRLLVSVDFLQQGASIQLGSFEVEPV